MLALCGLRTSIRVFRKRIALFSIAPYITIGDDEKDEPYDLIPLDSKKPVEGLPKAKKHKKKFISPWTTKQALKDVFALLFSNIVKNLSLLPRSELPLPRVMIDRNALVGHNHDHVTWMGHSTCYCHIDGFHFITDPIWSYRASPSQLFGPHRSQRTPIEVEELNIDFVLLSHTHYDHLDLPTAIRIGNKAKWIVPLGVKKILQSAGISNVVELDWWESHTMKNREGKVIEVVFTPANHWTSRTPFDRNRCLWGSFSVLSKRSRFFFGGDTAYCPVFKTIGQMYGPFDFAALPIGAYKPRWFMRHVHCNPIEAVQIHKDIQSKQTMAIHWGTFPLTTETSSEPALQLARARVAAGIQMKQFFTMAFGETLRIGGHPMHDFATKYPEMIDCIEEDDSDYDD